MAIPSRIWASTAGPTVRGRPDPPYGDGPDVLALCGRSERETVRCVRFYGYLGIEPSDGRGEWDNLDHRRVRVQDALGGDDNGRMTKSGLAALRHPEIHIDNVTRARHQARPFRRHAQRLGELVADTILTKGPDREGHRLAHGRPEIMGQPLEVLVGIRIYPHAGRVHANSIHYGHGPSGYPSGVPIEVEALDRPLAAHGDPSRARAVPPPEPPDHSRGTRRDPNLYAPRRYAHPRSHAALDQPHQVDDRDLPHENWAPALPCMAALRRAASRRANR